MWPPLSINGITAKSRAVLQKKITEIKPASK
jgi:hypothetical protein